MQTISLGFGAANFSTSSARLTAFSVKAPFLRTFATKTLKGRQPVSFPVSHAPAVNGTLFLSQVPDVADGEVICLQNSVRRHSRPYADYAIFVRTRITGPSYRIRAVIPTSRESTLAYNNHIMFVGRGDILTLDELQDAGFQPHRGFISNFMDAEDLEMCFSIEELQAAVSAAPKIERVVHEDGEVTNIVRVRDVRRMRIRKD